ncbi:MAG: coproporphyrinogen dehydrogenase HemZ, partial [Oscillospiraceae bacterium]|nr:coproporphyrinogen dehydrogenase HemZ [Oscillospiraceae bacterium]
MRLYLYGHEYKYAVEQMLFTMFPGEKPEYPEGKAQGDRIELKLSRAGKFTTASSRLCLDGKHFRGKAAERNPDLSDELELDRVCQRIIKKAIYRACLASGIKRPVWGALTGVRPGKILCSLLQKCSDEQEAVRQFIEEYDVSPERASLCLDTSRETLKAIAAMGEKDICLYVGIPFCPTRCTYCSFVSQSVEKSMKLIPPFLEALFKEVSATAQQVRELGL